MKHVLELDGVTKTFPGERRTILDRASLATVLGTVAGDDTVLVVCKESVGGASVAEELAELAGL